MNVHDGCSWPNCACTNLLRECRGESTQYSQILETTPAEVLKKRIYQARESDAKARLAAKKQIRNEDRDSARILLDLLCKQMEERRMLVISHDSMVSAGIADALEEHCITDGFKFRRFAERDGFCIVEVTFP